MRARIHAYMLTAMMMIIIMKEEKEREKKSRELKKTKSVVNMATMVASRRII